MQVGALVRWTADSDDYGCLGIVSKVTRWAFWVTWTDGDVVDYMHDHSHGKKMEVICE